VTGVIVGVLILVVFVLGVSLFYVLAREQSAGREPGRPDELSDEVVSRLMGELRKWQAESAHWKATAERLQRELDQRTDDAP
jgi:hypothetical protein